MPSGHFFGNPLLVADGAFECCGEADAALPGDSLQGVQRLTGEDDGQLVSPSLVFRWTAGAAVRARCVVEGRAQHGVSLSGTGDAGMSESVPQRHFLRKFSQG